MPNGNPDCDRPALDRFFGVIAPVIEAFVQRHHLRLQKYYHESSSWDLLFRHPQGGIAKIEVQREPGETLGIAAIWWYDDFDASTRYSGGLGKRSVYCPTRNSSSRNSKPRFVIYCRGGLANGTSATADTRCGRGRGRRRTFRTSAKIILIRFVEKIAKVKRAFWARGDDRSRKQQKIAGKSRFAKILTLILLRARLSQRRNNPTAGDDSWCTKHFRFAMTEIHGKGKTTACEQSYRRLEGR